VNDITLIEKKNMNKKNISLLPLLLIASVLFGAEMKTISISTNLMGEDSKIEFQTSSEEISLTLKPEGQEQIYSLLIQIEDTETKGQVKLTTYFVHAVELESGVSRNLGFEGLEATLTKGNEAVLYKKDSEHFTISLK
jgi:hypothetical protein